jgi:hypothetical protein
MPIVLPSGGVTAARRSHGAKQRSGYIEGESLVYSSYILPASSRDAAQRAWVNPSCSSNDTMMILVLLVSGLL